MDKTECQTWTENYLQTIMAIVPEALAVRRTDNALLIEVDTVKRAKASWHKQRDLERCAIQKRALRAQFPDLTKIVFQGPLAQANADGMLRTAAGWVFAGRSTARVQGDVHRNGCTVFRGDSAIAQFMVEYTSGRDPMPCGGDWRPFEPQYLQEAPYTQILTLARQDVAGRLGVTPELVEAFEAAIMADAEASALALAARIQQGRDDWAHLSQAERDALNEYALRVEGHTID